MFKVFKCGAGEGRGGLDGPIVLQIKRYYKKPSWKRNILLTVKQRKDNCIQWRNPPPEILMALQNRAKLNPIVKTVKNC